ncbi:MAG: nitrous oxide reductase accessory protein NosL, partial [Paracoccaceae bacterium]|nr:nitrous oxide reductase accessory protein NosL [Paracoccaceae bacterium]
DNWINAKDAVFVVGSAQAGGMGAPELVPFARRPEAEAFAAHNGGRVLTLAAIDDADVLTPVALEGNIGATDDGDYAARLHKLSQDLGG